MCELPISDTMKVEILLQKGELKLSAGETPDQLMEHGYKKLDDIGSHRIFGDIMFVGDDGGVYSMDVVPLVFEMEDHTIKDSAESMWDPSTNDRIYILADTPEYQKASPSRGYGYEIVKGKNFSVVRIGGIKHRNPLYLAVSNDRIFHECGPRPKKGFAWRHPDRH